MNVEFFVHIIKLTVILPLCENFGKVNLTLSNEVGFPRVVSITSQLHGLSTFDFPYSFVIFWRRWGSTPFGSSSQNVIIIFIDCEPDLLVPIWMLSTSFYGLCPSRLAIECY